MGQHGTVEGVVGRSVHHPGAGIILLNPTVENQIGGGQGFREVCPGGLGEGIDQVQIEGVETGAVTEDKSGISTRNSHTVHTSNMKTGHTKNSGHQNRHHHRRHRSGKPRKRSITLPGQHPATPCWVLCSPDLPIHDA